MSELTTLTTTSSISRPPPRMALRTYRFLRFGVLGMIALLGVSITWHNLLGDNRLLGSISAYYYTPVQSIFIGALVALGFAMIVLWGKTPAEDALFNLAGLLAPMVAFVPTRNVEKCDLLAPSGQPIDVDPTPDSLNEACKAAVTNNIGSYFIVLAAILVLLTALGIHAHRQQPPWPWAAMSPLGYWAPLGAAWALFAVGAGSYIFFTEIFYARAHFTSASVMFALIIAAIVVIAHQKRTGIESLAAAPEPRWSVIYLGLAAVMFFGALVVGGGTALWSHLGERGSYWVLAVELWLIFWLAIFWALQTRDRWRDGAPKASTDK